MTLDKDKGKLIYKITGNDKTTIQGDIEIDIDKYRLVVVMQHNEYGLGKCSKFTKSWDWVIGHFGQNRPDLGLGNL